MTLPRSMMTFESVGLGSMAVLASAFKASTTGSSERASDSCAQKYFCD